MTQEQGFFAAHIVDVKNTSGPFLRRLPHGVRALFGYEVDATLSFGGQRGLDVIELSPTPEAARQKGVERIAHWGRFSPGVNQSDFIIQVKQF